MRKTDCGACGLFACLCLSTDWPAPLRVARNVQKPPLPFPAPHGGGAKTSLLRLAVDSVSLRHVASAAAAAEVKRRLGSAHTQRTDNATQHNTKLLPHTQVQPLTHPHLSPPARATGDCPGESMQLVSSAPIANVLAISIWLIVAAGPLDNQGCNCNAQC